MSATQASLDLSIPLKVSYTLRYNKPDEECQGKCSSSCNQEDFDVLSTMIQLLNIHSKDGCGQVQGYVNKSKDCDCNDLV